MTLSRVSLRNGSYGRCRKWGFCTFSTYCTVDLNENKNISSAIRGRRCQRPACIASHDLRAAVPPTTTCIRMHARARPYMLVVFLSLAVAISVTALHDSSSVAARLRISSAQHYDHATADDARSTGLRRQIRTPQNAWRGPRGLNETATLIGVPSVSYSVNMTFGSPPQVVCRSSVVYSTI